MNKEELIKRYKDTTFTIVSIAGVLEDLKQLDEPQKPVVPQFIADLIEEARTYEWDLDDLFEHISDYSGDSEVYIWFYTLGNIDVLARAWLDGYTVEEEKRYWVKMKGILAGNNFLNHRIPEEIWSFSSKTESTLYKTKHTRKELEDAGFGEVFNSSLFEVEEVEK